MKRKANLPYTPIPNEVLDDPSLTPTEKLLFLLILKFANKNGVCFASQETLGYYMSRTSRQVKTLINNLKDRSLIKVDPPIEFKGTNSYIPLITFEGKSTSPHTGKIYQYTTSGKKGNKLPTKNIRKLNIKTMKEELMEKMK